MKISGFIFVMYIIFCGSKLIAQYDSGNTNYLQHTDTTKVDKTNNYNQQAPASTYMMDATFITNAANSNMEEVQLGKLAEAKAISESVKKYARMIQNDHNNANDKLKNLAMTNSITVDSAIKSENRQKVNDLSTLSGASFDKEYINLMVENNQKDIQEFENASSKVRNTQLKSWIDKTLPTLKKHLQEAQRIQNELNKM